LRRDFDDDVEILRKVFACGDVIEAHERSLIRWNSEHGVRRVNSSGVNRETRQDEALRPDNA
jgi:hypothetical protein